MSEHYLDIRDDIEKNFDKEVDSIFEEHYFFLDYTGDHDFPDTATERYELLKDSTCKWHFYDSKKLYLMLAYRDNDILSIRSQLQKLDEIRCHEKLGNTVAKNNLYLSAKKYIEDTVVNNLVDNIENRYTQEEVTLYLYILHDTNYFETFFLPDEAFGIDKTKNNIELIGEVYGKYFLFYDYLRDNLHTLQGVSPEPEAKKEVHAHEDIPESKGITNPGFDPTTTLCKIWRGDLKKYDRLVELLKKEYRETSQPFVTEMDKEIHWNIYPAKGTQKYLMGLLYVLNEMDFIKLNLFSNVQLMTICKNTFHCKKLDPGNFPLIRGGQISNAYTDPFIELLKSL